MRKTSYKVVVSEGVRDVLRKITFEQQKKLYSILVSLGKDPFPARAEKIPTSVASFRITDGAFRILYEVDGTTIRVEAIRSILADLL